MKTTWPILLSLLLLAAPAAVQAQDAYSTNADGSIYTYSTNADGSANIVAYAGPPWVVTIPTNINGLTVTSIGDNGFVDCTGLTSVTIPASVTSIGASAFGLCGSLTNLTVGDGVTNIGDYAFYDCGDLTSVTIPNSVSTIGGNAFYACPSLTNATIGSGVTSIAVGAFSSCFSLTSITVSLQNSNYSGKNGVLFNQNQTTLVLYPGGLSGSYSIPGTVTAIEDDAFDNCGNLTGVTMGNSVTNIGEYAFYHCDGLTHVIINGAASIGDYAFNECESLTDLALGNGVASIGVFAFEDTGLTSVTIPDTVTSIGDYAFAYTGLTSVTLPGSVTNIGDNVFGSCASLTAITVAAQNPAYSSLNGVLFDKSQTTLVEYPAGLGGIYTIPVGVITIGEGAFEGTSLTGVTIPNSVANIGDDAFESTSLTNVTIGDGVTNIGEDAFADCSSLTSVTIPNSVTSIGEFAFGATGLTSVTIPKTLTSIGDYAFAASALTSAYFLGNAPPDDGTAFQFDTATVYYLPGTTGWGSTFGSVPAVLWNPQANAAGVSAGQFGFDITGPTNATIIVEACTNLSHPVWAPISTNTLTGGSSYFSDSQWTNYPARFYGFGFP